MSADRDALLAAARYERDRRAESYPQAIFNGKVTAEHAAVDYQCWVAIAEWVETDRFFGFYGGIPPRNGEGDREAVEGPWIGWPELEAAALRALHSIERKLAAEAWFDGCPPTATSERRCALTRIHRAIQLQRESVEAINAEFRRPSPLEGEGYSAAAERGEGIAA